MSLSEGAESSWVAGHLPREGMSECTRNWVAELAFATLLGARFAMLESRDEMESVVRRN